MPQKVEIKYHKHKCYANNNNNKSLLWPKTGGSTQSLQHTWRSLGHLPSESLIFSICKMRGFGSAFQDFFQPKTSSHFFFPFIFPSSSLFFFYLKNLIQKLKAKSRGALGERHNIPELGLFAQLYLSPLGIPRTLRETALKTLISCSALFYVISKPQSVAQCWSHISDPQISLQDDKKGNDPVFWSLL